MLEVDQVAFSADEDRQLPEKEGRNLVVWEASYPEEVVHQDHQMAFEVLAYLLEVVDLLEDLQIYFWAYLQVLVL